MTMTITQQMTQAFSYVRYSSAIQAEGDSDRRQNERVSHWLVNHAGFTLVHEYSDEGVSAFKTETDSKGNIVSGLLMEGTDLYQLVTDCERGIYQKGAVLLVEALDRLSRGGIDATQQLVRRILLANIRIVILQDNPDKFYDKSDLNDAFAVITIAIKAQAAYEESEKKQKRGLINWTNKRLKASKGEIMTRACPAWLTVDEEGKKFLPVEPHLTTVRRIFKMRLSGHSMVGIAKILNEDNTPNFKPRIVKNDEGKIIDRVMSSGRWNQTTIQQLLINPAVFGQKVISKQATDNVKSSAAPIENYYKWQNETTGEYEVAISLADFTEVNKIASGWAKGRAQSNDDPRLTNIFKGVLVCGLCGASVIQASIKPVSPKHYTYGYFVCSQRRLGRCNDSKAVRRDQLETAIIQGLMYHVEKLLSGTKADEKELLQMEAEELQIQAKRKKLVSLLMDDMIDRQEYDTRYNALGASLDQLQKQIEQHRQVMEVDYPTNLVLNLDLTKKEQRFELQKIVGRYFSTIRLDGVSKTCDIELKSGYKLNRFPVDKVIDGESWIEVLHLIGEKEHTFDGTETQAPSHWLFKNAPDWVNAAQEQESYRKPTE